jgi:hypothetical protein
MRRTARGAWRKRHGEPLLHLIQQSSLADVFRCRFGERIPQGADTRWPVSINSVFINIRRGSACFLKAN